MITKEQVKAAITALAVANEEGAITPAYLGDVLDKLQQYAEEGLSSFVKSFETITSISELPASPTDAQKTVAYVLGAKCYVYVGEGGDAASGKYQSIGFGTPTDAQVTEAVGDYMETHPIEAVDADNVGYTEGSETSEGNKVSDKLTFLSRKIVGENDESKIELDLTTHDGKYIDSTGYTGTLAGYAISTPIALSKGESIKAIASGTKDKPIIAKVLTDGSRYTSVDVNYSASKALETHTYTADTDCEVAVCGITANGITAYKVVYTKSIDEKIEEIRSGEENNSEAIENISAKEENNSNKIEEIAAKIEGEDTETEITLDLTTNNGKYIDSTGYTGALAGYAISTPIALSKGESIKAIASGTKDKPIIAKVLTDGSRYTSVDVNYSASKALETHTYTADTDCEVAVCGITANGISAYKIVKGKSINEKIEDIQDQEEINSEKVVENYKQDRGDLMQYWFSNVICCGDSVTQGHVYDYPRTPANGKIYEDKSYPSWLAKMTGWNVTNAGRAGWTAVKWWEDLFSTLDFTQYEMAIIELGYNGHFDGLSIATSVEPYTSYSDYLEDNLGCYCKIIEAMREQKDNIFIVLVISPLFKTHDVEIINAIAERYSLPVINLMEADYIDLNDEKYHGYTDSSETLNTVHFNFIGYLAKARMIYRCLSDIINDNAKTINNMLNVS